MAEKANKGSLELSALHVIVPAGVEGRPSGHPKFIFDNVEGILRMVDPNDQSFYDEESRTRRSYVEGVVYGPVDMKPRREIGFEEYVQMGRPKSIPDEINCKEVE